MNPSAFSLKLLHPKYWPVWLLAVPLLVLAACLPWPVQQRMGRGLGWLVWRVIGQRRRDTETNIALCFPEKSPQEQADMVRDIFRNAGISIFETANAWLRPIGYYDRRVTIEGLAHLQQALQQGRGVLLLGAHYSFVDLCGLLAMRYFPIDTVYRPQNNAALEWLIVRLRRRIYQYQIDHDNMRLLIRALKENHVVWYTPDQDFGLKQGVFAPFFGVNAATLTSPRRLQKINRSPVLFVHFRRAGLDERYEMLITPPLEDFPTEDITADATRINQVLETLIRRSPTQYMWYHRRFKTRPPGETMPYPRKRRHLKQLAKAEAARRKEQDQ
ncbi:MAG: LpxL/LpxP family Kdo(2)-lipid IV(A) lauroyl/palmitoleoyl acyltransferase [Fluviicoccus sp.]|uniref:LpxL/LpxP family Kdo(2)-lipid IV(A) lauroyl/palmitoleoyl acyltransferase n=1 Tax=Fluviicoccus sp. TaxID=2003552 RepID=UPI0027193352|nr:LpxL/LpxP family Kdo(2)-lipid IV(A) lauroyl/palmitoleoyl acyltransferase [Fluviicoccus sp.]MDO8330024.1 LpxL/LpxP family Kdo(2)-lipid IV(A) lauroyl/palmitoleoyl acyltransferase [Fluviicoccus sp.]